LSKDILFTILLQGIRHRGNVIESSERKIFHVSSALQNNSIWIGGKMFNVRYSAVQKKKVTMLHSNWRKVCMILVLDWKQAPEKQSSSWLTQGVKKPHLTGQHNWSNYFHMKSDPSIIFLYTGKHQADIALCFIDL